MEEERQEKPNFAIRVLVFKDGKVLLGENLGNFAPGVYGPPGGHLEHGESFEHCAKREAREEAGIEIKNVAFLSIINSMEFEPYHNVSIVMTADWDSGEPRTMEPEKRGKWDWYHLGDLPEPLFHNCELALEAYQSGKTCFDIEE